MMDYLDGLNPSQRKAVTATEGFIRVIAGAGSGKTRALSRRFAFLVDELGILPGHILCVTFTNKSANEMRQRIHNLTGDNDTGYINTFHGFCVSILQEDSHAIQYPKSFLVLDNADIDAMLQLVYDERGLTLRNMTFSRARDMIEIRKLFKEPDYYRDMIIMSLDTLKQKYMDASRAEDIIFYGYLYQEKKCFGLDYNDLIKFSLYIFAENEDIKKKWQQRLEYIMIDEFQDIDKLQYQLMEVLCGYHKNLFIVGDPDQTIYTWRGANATYLMDFDKIFPNVTTVMMMQNYRSTPQILAAANSLISKNCHRLEKKLVAMLPDGQPVLGYHGETQEAEAAWVVGQIQACYEQGISYRDMTVLYRAHYVTRPVEEALMREQIPYTLYSGTQFFNRREIKDALSYLRIIVYKDDLSFLRIVNIPKRNLGKRRIAFLQKYAEQKECSLYQALHENMEETLFKGTGALSFISLIENVAANQGERPVSEVLSDILDKSGYESLLRTEGSQERLDNLAELKQSVYEYEMACGEESTLEQYLAHVALFTNRDAETRVDKIKLMTVHAAKGLEFPYVFLCGMNEGIFPSRRTRTRQGMEEERRLAFVAMTRAEKGLYLSEAAGSHFDGSLRYPSRFLLDIAPELLTYMQAPQEELIQEARDYVARSQRYLAEPPGKSGFAVGQRVKHGIFGWGTVLEVEQDQAANVVQFDNMKTPRRISFKVRLEQT